MAVGRMAWLAFELLAVLGARLDVEAICAIHTHNFQLNQVRLRLSKDESIAVRHAGSRGEGSYSCYVCVWPSGVMALLKVLWPH